MKYLIATSALVAAVVLGIGTANSQHRHGGHAGGHHGGHAPAHHGIHFGHHNWHHVVPHHGIHVGAYYTIGARHYYTPSPVTRIVTVDSSPLLPPPTVVEVQKPVELGFAGFGRYEDLAGRLAFEANAICLDMHYNYKHNKNFTEVYAEAYAALQAAKYIQGRDHQGNREIIRKRVAEVDRLFHHVQNEMAGWTRLATRQIGADMLPEKLARAEAVLHHLCYDAGVNPHEQKMEIAPPPGDPTETAPPPAGKQ